MKLNKNYIFAILAVMAFAFTGCNDDLLGGQGTPKSTGDEIAFGGRASFEMNKKGAKKAATRTVYTGTMFEKNGNTYEGVEWTTNDKVRIYSPQAAGINPADYTVSINAEDKSQASLTKIGDGALQWSSTTDPYDFYAVYPSPEQYLGNGVGRNDVLGGNAIVRGVIPSTQLPIGKVTKEKSIDNSDFKEANKNNTYMQATLNKMGMGDHHIIQPNMKYAYMVARTQVEDPNAIKDVYLNFMPIATAVEITLRNLAWKEDVSTGQTFNLSNVIISSRSGSPLSGGFSADLSTMALDADGSATGYPTGVEMVDDLSKSTTISVPTVFDGSHLELKFGDAITFTVFMLPTNDIEDINITINGLQGIRTGTLSGITVEKHKKTYLRNVPITGDVLPFDFASWIQWLDDDVLVRSLSIPGSGGSATYHLTKNGTVDGNTVTADMVRQQNYSIEKQWKAGVRCFELAVDVNDTNANNSLGGSKIVCSGLELDYTLSEAVNEVKSLLLANHHEFAMVIVTYDTKGGWYTKGNNNKYTSNRNPALFMKQLNNFWTEVSGSNDWANKNAELEEAGSPITMGTALYDPRNVTVGNARGKLYCIARPTSINVDYGDYVLYDPFVNGSLAADGTYKWTGLGTTSEYLVNHGTHKVARPDLECHDNILIIHGWGNDKDKWGQRGFSRYSVRRTVCNDQSLWSDFSFKSDWSNSRPSLNWIHTCTTLPKGTEITYSGQTYTTTVDKDNRPGRPFDTSKMSSTGTSYGTSSVTYNGTKYYGALAIAEHYAYEVSSLKPDFTYETSTGINAWVQEWARVSPNSNVYTILATKATNDVEAYSLLWTESYTEKFERVKETLRYAQTKEKGDIVYINSLSGFHITNDYPQSIQPCANVDASVFWMWGGEISTPSATSTTAGMGGDIAGYADKINTDFYNYLLSIDTDYEAGSMGIILIDRVGDGGAGANIPGVIIANNFQFDLESEVNQVFGLHDVENEDPQYAPATRGADGEEEVMMVWE